MGRRKYSYGTLTRPWHERVSMITNIEASSKFKVNCLMADAFPTGQLGGAGWTLLVYFICGIIKYWSPVQIIKVSY